RHEVLGGGEFEPHRVGHPVAGDVVATHQRGPRRDVVAAALVRPQHVAAFGIDVIRGEARLHRAPRLHRLAVAHGHRILDRLALAGVRAAAPVVADAVGTAVGEGNAGGGIATDVV